MEEVELDGRRWQERRGPFVVVKGSKRHVRPNCGTISANVRRPANFLFFRRTEHRHRQIDIYSRTARRFHVFLLQPTDLALSGSLTLRRLPFDKVATAGNLRAL